MSQTPLRIRGARLAVALLVALLAAGCGGMLGGKKSVQLTLSATDQCNTCGRANAQPLEFAVLQVTDASAITGTSLVQIWGKEKALFGDALLTRDTGSIVPSSKQPFVYQRDPKAKAVIVIGNFCKPEASCWYFVKPLAKGSKIQLKAEASCLTVVTK